MQIITCCIPLLCPEIKKTRNQSHKTGSVYSDSYIKCLCLGL